MSTSAHLSLLLLPWPGAHSSRVCPPAPAPHRSHPHTLGQRIYVWNTVHLIFICKWLCVFTRSETAVTRALFNGIMSTTNATNHMKKMLTVIYGTKFIKFNFLLLVPSGPNIDLLTQCAPAPTISRASVDGGGAARLPEPDTLRAAPVWKVSERLARARILTYPRQLKGHELCSWPSRHLAFKTCIVITNQRLSLIGNKASYRTAKLQPNSSQLTSYFPVWFCGPTIFIPLKPNSTLGTTYRYCNL